MKKHVKTSIALCALLVPGLAMGQAANFLPATGDYAVDANWDTGLVPVPGETAAVYGGICTVTTTQDVGSILMSDGGSYTIAAGGDLTASAQALIGNPGAGSLLVDGGSFSAGTEFALGVGGGNSGSVTLNSGSITSLSLLGVGWGGGSGTLTVHGGVLNANALDLGAFGGNGDITLNAGTISAAAGFNASAGTGTLVINGGVMSALSLNFDGPAKVVDINGGQLIATSGGFIAGTTTFNIGLGELIFGNATKAAVDDLIDTTGTWNFSGARSVTQVGSDVVVTSQDSASVPFPALAEDVVGPELIPNADFATITNNVDNPAVPSDLWYVTGSKGDLWAWYEGYADLVDWSFYYADPTNITPLVGTAGAEDIDTATYPLDGTTLLDTWIDGTHVILSSTHSYRNGMKSEDILNGATINPAGTYNFEISGYAQWDSANATVTAALTAGADATNTANAVAGSLIQAPIADLSNALSVQVSGADLTNGQVNVMFHVENTDVLPGVAEGSNALIRANYQNTGYPNSQTWFTSISLHETSVPEEGDLNRDGALNFFDLELGNAYLDGSVDGGDDAATRQAYWIGEGLTPAEALAQLNLTEFDLNGDDTFDAADIAILDTLTAHVIVSGTMNGSGHYEVVADRLAAGIDYYLMRTTDLNTPFDTQADSITAAGDTDTLTDTTPPAGEAFYKVVR